MRESGRLVETFLYTIPAVVIDVSVPRAASVRDVRNRIAVAGLATAEITGACGLVPRDFDPGFLHHFFSILQALRTHGSSNKQKLSLPAKIPT
jgi:hypothetical protein